MFVCLCGFKVFVCVRCDVVCDVARCDVVCVCVRVFVCVVVFMCVVSVRYSVMLYGRCLVMRFVVFVYASICVVCF